MDMFKHVENYAGDPILSLVADFNNDKRENKVNLSIGYYYDEQGQVPQLNTIKKARDYHYTHNTHAQTYLPISGLPAFNKAVQSLLLSQTSALDNIVTVQTLGGSGALKIGADFLHRYFPNSEVWVSDPTWENHIAIFSGAGFNVKKYPYFNPENHSVNFTAMLETIRQLPPKTIVLLHPCCHNPTGADLTHEQWDQLLTLIKKQDLIPFMDIAYLGFGVNIEDDSYALKKMVEMQLSGFISNSFSKTFSLYGERVGSLSAVCANQQEAMRVFGQLQATIRKNYSSPAAYGATLANYVLSHEELKNEWFTEVDAMRNRIIEMRNALVKALKEIAPNHNFDFITHQKGLFSYTGFTKEQVAQLKDKYAIYLVGSGRMCLAGLTKNNVSRVAEAFAAIV